jgi:hypothetical protein
MMADKQIVRKRGEVQDTNYLLGTAEDLIRIKSDGSWSKEICAAEKRRVVQET